MTDGSNINEHSFIYRMNLRIDGFSANIDFEMITDLSNKAFADL